MKRIGKFTIVPALLCFLLIPVSDCFANCDQMIAESEAIEGVVPRLNDDGSLRSLSMYGISSFLAPKPSLVSAARKQAEMKGKRDFANFMEEQIKAGTLSDYLMETKTVTDESGQMSGSAEEINRVVDQIQSNAQAVLSGVIKLDECMDPAQKIVIVRMGWKPELSEMAADTRQKINEEVARGKQGSSSSGGSGKTAAPSSSGYRKKSSMADDF
ncbi:MAG: hypothetical protein C0624_07820 [Desulfuromonas sp.]|nr:MAG: hypothetical protein C0624_07820 [Desulfuromonas sp.]